MVATLPPELCAIILSYVGDEKCEPLRALAGDAQDVSVSIGRYGNLLTRVNGRLHSIRDEPAVTGNITCWFRDGLCHRDGDKPAVIYDNGTQMWCRDGLIWREGGKPTIVLKGSNAYVTYGPLNATRLITI